MHKEHIEAKVRHLLDLATENSTSPTDALENPGYGVYCMLVDTVKMWEELKGKPPTRVHLTKRLEALLSDYARKEGDIYFSKKKKILGMRIIRGALSFQLE